LVIDVASLLAPKRGVFGIDIVRRNIRRNGLRGLKNKRKFRFARLA
jgi:hypothetical protein